MPDFNFKFNVGKKKKTMKDYVIFSVIFASITIIAVPYLNRFIKSEIGKTVNGIICNSPYLLMPDGQIKRLIYGWCKSIEDGNLDDDEFGHLVDRAQQFSKNEDFNEFFWKDPKILDKRVKAEVGLAIDSYNASIDAKIANTPCSTWINYLADSSQAQQQLGGAMEIEFKGPLGECNLQKYDYQNREHSFPGPKIN
jgi:hypothetical protein